MDAVISLRGGVSILYLSSEYNATKYFFRFNFYYKNVIGCCNFDLIKHEQFRRPFTSLTDANNFLAECWASFDSKMNKKAPQLGSEQDLAELNAALEFSSWRVKDVLRCIDRSRPDPSSPPGYSFQGLNQGLVRWYQESISTDRRLHLDPQDKTWS